MGGKDNHYASVAGLVANEGLDERFRQLLIIRQNCKIIFTVEVFFFLIAEVIGIIIQRDMIYWLPEMSIITDRRPGVRNVFFCQLINEMNR